MHNEYTHSLTATVPTYRHSVYAQNESYTVYIECIIYSTHIMYHIQYTQNVSFALYTEYVLILCSLCIAVHCTLHTAQCTHWMQYTARMIYIFRVNLFIAGKTGNSTEHRCSILHLPWIMKALCLILCVVWYVSSGQVPGTTNWSF